MPIAAGFFRTYDDLGNYAPRQGIAADLLPVLTLSLYDSEFFTVPAILITELGWRLLRPRFAGRPWGPHGDISHHYEVDDQTGKFQTFVELSESALKAVVAWRSFITAATHYLIGTFCTRLFISVVGTPVKSCRTWRYASITKQF